MNNRNKDIVILGAGPAGLTAGYRIAQNGRNLSIIEKNNTVGGLAKTLQYNDCLLDIGPHILCSREYVYDFNPEMYALIQSLLGNELYEYESANQLYLESVWVGGAKYRYPVHILNAIKNVGLRRAIKIGMDYFHAGLSKSSGPDYQTSLYSSLGKSLSELFLINIGEKNWGVPCNKMSADVVMRVGDFSLLDIMIKQLKSLPGIFSKKGSPVTYPKNGIGNICDRLKEEIDKTGNAEWFFSSIPEKICVENSLVTSMEILCQDGTHQTLNPSYLISSIPLPTLLSVIEPKPPADVIDAANQLRFRCHVCLYLIFKSDSILKDHCIYFADPEIPFARMMEQKHYSDSMIPIGKTVLSVEFFSWLNEGSWIMSDSDICNVALHWMKKLGLIHDQVLEDFFVHREQDAYPAYELGYDVHHAKISAYLDGIANLDVIGRAGSFKYIGQYKVMQMGWDVAGIINNTMGMYE